MKTRAVPPSAPRPPQQLAARHSRGRDEVEGVPSNVLHQVTTVGAAAVPDGADWGESSGGVPAATTAAAISAVASASSPVASTGVKNGKVDTDAMATNVEMAQIQKTDKLMQLAQQRLPEHAPVDHASTLRVN